MAAVTPAWETTRCLCLAARRAARTITRRFDAALRPHGLRSTQFTLLAALSLAGPMAISRLADMLANDRTTVTRNLAIVAKRGLVEINVDTADARSRIASITDSGRELLQAALPAWRAVQTALTDELGTEASLGLQRLAGGPCVMPIPASNPPRNDPWEPGRWKLSKAKK